MEMGSIGTPMLIVETGDLNPGPCSRLRPIAVFEES